MTKRKSSDGDHDQGIELEFHKPGLLFRLRNWLLAGVVVTAPISITAYLTWLFIDFVDTTVKSFLPQAYNPDTYLPFAVPGLGLLIVIALLIGIGAFAAGFVGRLFVRLADSLVARMPVVRTLYGAIKQIFETVFAARAEAFRQVVLIEYPRRGSWAMGFLTGTTAGEVQNITEDEMVNIFMPTTPNPTSGFLLFLPRREVRILHMSVEDGIKMIVSGGIVTPPDTRPKAVKEADEPVDQPPLAAKSAE